jgi:hypothetical protein
MPLHRTSFPAWEVLCFLVCCSFDIFYLLFSIFYQCYLVQPLSDWSYPFDSSDAP